MNLNIADHIGINSKLSRTFLVRVESVYDRLKSAEKSAMDTILSSEEISAESSITSISSAAGCSDATLVRLARKLGFSGFAEMKDNMFVSSSADSSREGGLDDVSSVIEALFRSAENSLSDTRQLLRPAAIAEAAEMLRNAGIIMFVGTGDAALIARAGHLKFEKACRTSFCDFDFDVQLTRASRLKEKDVVVAISHSGMTKQVCEIAKIAKRHHAQVVAITAHPISRLAKISDVIIQTASFTDDSFDEIMANRIPVYAIIELLFNLSVDKQSEAVKDAIQKANMELAINKYR